MDGDLLALIAGNDVILCSNSLHEGKLENYCAGIFNAVDLPPIASMFSLRPVADADVLEVIENEGVKSITLDATAFVASGARAQRRSLRRTLNDRMRNVVTALFGEDEDLQTLNQQDNVSAEIVLKFDRRKAGGEIGQQKMETLAKSLASEPEGGAVIRTFRNTRVGAGQLSLQKPVRIRADGKTVARDAAFTELVTYYQELRDAGHLSN